MKERERRSEPNMATRNPLTEIEVHQGSALSPFLFILVIDTLTADTGIGLPWELIFADDIALMAEAEEELREKVGK